MFFFCFYCTKKAARESGFFVVTINLLSDENFSTTDQRKNVSFKFRIDQLQILDFLFFVRGIVDLVEDSILILDVGVLNEFLERIPVRAVAIVRAFTGGIMGTGSLICTPRVRIRCLLPLHPIIEIVPFS